MFSKPWAWFWTVVVGVASGAAAFLAMSASGVQTGWSITAAAGVLILCGGGCAFYILDKRSATKPVAPNSEKR